MCSPSVLRYFSWLGTQFEGSGHVVECGCWLGALSVAFASTAFEQMKTAGKKLYAIDTFKWEAWMHNYPEDTAPLSDVPDIGDDYLSMANNFISPYAEVVETRQGIFGPNHNVPQMQNVNWTAEAIEILSYDMGSNRELLDDVWSIFSPWLTSPATIVFHEYGKLQSVDIREFCRDHSDVLTMKDGPIGTLRSFSYRL
jgi:hypothetical protein